MIKNNHLELLKLMPDSRSHKNIVLSSGIDFALLDLDIIKC